MIGVELDSGARTLALMRALLSRGYIVLPAGKDAEALSITPPLTIAPELMRALARELDALLEATP
jgi:4-aminobutyrate aminotransferase-like enzyme